MASYQIVTRKDRTGMYRSKRVREINDPDYPAGHDLRGIVKDAHLHDTL